MNKRILTSLFILLCISTTLTAQTPVKKAKLVNPFENQGTINSRFNYLYKTSTNYQEYKVISRKAFVALQKNVKDSLVSLKKEITTQTQKNKEQESKINSLNTTLEKANNELSNANTNRDSISVLGIQLYKKNYNLIVLLIIITLAVIASFFIFKFKNSHVLTAEAKKLLSETQNEFEIFQKKSLERQQVINRKLQDEINKNKKD